jgi:hypothetical protein
MLTILKSKVSVNFKTTTYLWRHTRYYSHVVAIDDEVIVVFLIMEICQPGMYYLMVLLDKRKTIKSLLIELTWLDSMQHSQQAGNFLNQTEDGSTIYFSICPFMCIVEHTFFNNFESG